MKQSPKFKKGQKVLNRVDKKEYIISENPTWNGLSYMYSLQSSDMRVGEMYLTKIDYENDIISDNTIALAIKDRVERVGSVRDYTTGRKGSIVEIDESNKRARVLWNESRVGGAINIRTWVKFTFLKKIEN